MDSEEHSKRFLASIAGITAATTSLAAGIYCNGFLSQIESSHPGAGYQWMCNILEGSPDICKKKFRMEAHVVYSLCNDLVEMYGLRNTNISALEKVGIFLFLLGAKKVRDAMSIFSHSGETITRVFKEVLNCVVGRESGFMGLVSKMVRTQDKSVGGIHPLLANDRRYSPWFNDCIGAINGTHISANLQHIDPKDALKYIDRKSSVSFNVLACCDFDLHFTFVAAGYEGFAHDAKVLAHVLSAENRGLFPIPPVGKYYVADKGFPDRFGFLTPYHNTKYHLRAFRQRGPENRKELFNHVHSSLRSCIERSFGCLKKKFSILDNMPPFKLDTQEDMVVACFTLHNYIRKHMTNDEDFSEALREPAQVSRCRDVTADAEHEVLPPEDTAPQAQRVIMSALRDDIATALWSHLRG